MPSRCASFWVMPLLLSVMTATLLISLSFLSVLFFYTVTASDTLSLAATIMGMSSPLYGLSPTVTSSFTVS